MAYVWGKYCENKELIHMLKNLNISLTHSYNSGEHESLNSDIVFINYKNIGKIKKIYDLVIFDDITCFSNINRNTAREICDKCLKIGERIISYTIEKSSLIGEKIELVAHNYEYPFVEPRIIKTRINLNIDIPYTMYEYLKWFKESNQKVVIYSQDKKSIGKIYDYFNEKLKLKGVKIAKATTIDEIKRCEKVLKRKEKAIFIITNKIEEILEYCHIDNVIIMFNDENTHTYKKLLYICGKIRVINYVSPEVLLVCNEVSEDIDRAKEMARDFNKKVWDKKLKELQR